MPDFAKLLGAALPEITRPYNRGELIKAILEKAKTDRLFKKRWLVAIKAGLKVHFRPVINPGAPGGFFWRNMTISIPPHNKLTLSMLMELLGHEIVHARDEARFRLGKAMSMITVFLRNGRIASEINTLANCLAAGGTIDPKALSELLPSVRLTQTKLFFGGPLPPDQVPHFAGALGDVAIGRGDILPVYLISSGKVYKTTFDVGYYYGVLMV